MDTRHACILVFTSSSPPCPPSLPSLAPSHLHSRPPVSCHLLFCSLIYLWCEFLIQEKQWGAGLCAWITSLRILVSRCLSCKRLRFHRWTDLSTGQLPPVPLLVDFSHLTQVISNCVNFSEACMILKTLSLLPSSFLLTDIPGFCPKAFVYVLVSDILT